MKTTFRTLLVASAVAVAAASLGTIGIDAQQAGQAQQSQSSQSGQSTQSTEPTQSSPQSTQPGARGRDEAAARQELVQAKQSLMELTKLPEASQLQGEARNGVIQIINAFNSLVTADANWFDRYKDVQQQLTRILASDSSTSASSGTPTSGAEAGSTGTSGTTSAAMPPAVRSKLMEFRQHLEAFGKAAGAPDNGSPAGSGSSAGYSAPGQSSTSATTTGTTSSQSATTGTSSAGTQAGAVTSAAGETFQQHFDAISDLVQQSLGSSPSPSSSTTGTSGTSGSTTTSGTTTSGSVTSGTGTSGAASASGSVNVDRATLEQIQSHLQRLRELARQRGIQ